MKQIFFNEECHYYGHHTLSPVHIFISMCIRLRETIKLDFSAMNVDVAKLHNVAIFKLTKIKIASEQPMLLEK